MCLSGFSISANGEWFVAKLVRQVMIDVESILKGKSNSFIYLFSLKHLFNSFDDIISDPKSSTPSFYHRLPMSQLSPIVSVATFRR